VRVFLNFLYHLSSDTSPITEPLTQIVGGVMMLLAGVLNLLGNLLSGLGLDSLLKGIVAATVSFPVSRQATQSMTDMSPSRASIKFTRDLDWGNG